MSPVKTMAYGNDLLTIAAQLLDSADRQGVLMAGATA